MVSRGTLRGHLSDTALQRLGPAGVRSVRSGCGPGSRRRIESPRSAPISEKTVEAAGSGPAQRGGTAVVRPSASSGAFVPRPKAADLIRAEVPRRAADTFALWKEHAATDWFPRGRCG